MSAPTRSLRNCLRVTDAAKPTAYDEFDGTPAWEVVDRAISDLVVNQDLGETTLRYYIVGYIVKALSEAELLRT